MTPTEQHYVDTINSVESERDFWKRRASKFEAALAIARSMIPMDRLLMLAAVCRSTEGVCFCGAHTGTEAMLASCKTWTCGCGTVNGVNLATCRVCGRKEGET